ncbi:2FeCpFd [Delftia tsuruhatensis]|uniref:(2Fe-2S) ferredoxin domain-containing protein n=1 Tax=Delftia tsuruhatensis TaxID=180282 RepID=UPI001E6A92E3|nr:(2Fe-2S) ferredoxin domain-containing protein [Delftia tsuruhatensis]CAB5703697.1 2FeCpFd [Delftia tsuruhatensis]CAC9684354.1 2FeCpFd [Delftia tsuruhatensis]
MKTSDAFPAPSCSGLPDAVVVLGRGGTGAASRQSLTDLAEALRDMLEPACQVVAAFVDKASPSLPEALQQCLPARCIVVLPLFSPDEPALLRWLHKLAMRWRSAQQEQGTQVRFADPLLGASAMPALLLAQITGAMRISDIADTAGDNWQHDPHAWSQVPEHQHHALVCTGPRCTALGAVDVWHSLGDAVQASSTLRGRLRLLQTSCQYPCNQGPLAIVYPEGVWYGRLTAGNAGPVIESHVLQRRVCRTHHVHGPVELSPQDLRAGPAPAEPA